MRRVLLHAASAVQELRRVERWLIDKCVVWAKAHAHPEAERANDLGGVRGRAPKAHSLSRPFDGFHALPASVSTTCLVRFDNNRCSVSASAVGRPVDIHAYADRIVVRQDEAGCCRA